MPPIYIYIYRRAIFLVLLLVAMGVSGINLVGSAYADSQNVTYNVSVESSLSIEVSANTVSLLLNPASNPFDTEDLTITVGTNYINGYNLFINSDSTSLLNDDYETDYYMETLPATTTVAEFPDNYWGYRISSGNTGESTITNSNYHPFVSHTLVSSSSTAVNGNETVLTFAAKANYDKPAGSYDNTFSFSSVINPVTYSISYTDTSGDTTVADLPATETGMLTNGTATITSSTPTRTGYNFYKWCNGTVSGSTCSGTEVSAGGTIDFTDDAGPNVTAELTAMWEIACQSVIAGNMQDFDPASLCDGVTSGTLTDSRDSKSYNVAKLADGKWWMTSNLNLAGGTALSADNTDVTSTYINGFSTSGGLTKDATNGTITLPSSSTSGFSSDTDAYVYNTTNSYGGYYSWFAAMLGGKRANGSTAVSDYYNAAASICPKGWRLPTATTSNADAQTSPNWKTGDFYALATAYGANLESNYYDSSSTTGGNFYTNAGPGTTPNFLLAGYYSSSSPYNVGSDGYYWSSTSRSSTYAYALYFDSSYVYSAYGNRRKFGFSVRCILAE